MHAVPSELGEALTEQRADEILGARKVGLQDGELEVEVRVLVVGCPGGVGIITGGVERGGG